MRTISQLVPVALFAGAVIISQACGNITAENQGGQEFPVAGVIRGTVAYTGPAPCSQNGHIVGNAIVLVFDRRNPPPPNGLANTAVNFGVVPGDALFADQPVNLGSNLACPDQSVTVQASGQFAISPMSAGSYLIQGFYDYTGDFLPTFKFRELPEATDVGGGYIDVNDATSLEVVGTNVLANDAGTAPIYEVKENDPNYQPIFLPVDVGIPGAVEPGSLRGVPTFTMPDNGFIADNVTVNLGSKLAMARPYFYPGAYINPSSTGGTPILPTANTIPVKPNGDSSTIPTTKLVTAGNADGNPQYQAVLTFPNSLQVYAPPSLTEGTLHPDFVNEFQASFPQIRLTAGVPAPEAATAASTTIATDPFHMQLTPANSGNGGIYVWWNNPPGSNDDTNLIPEKNDVPRLWPLVVLAKLQDDPTHTIDPQNLAAQGSDLKSPIVIIQGITISEDSLFYTAQQRQCVDSNPAGTACFSLTPPASPETKTVTKILSAPDPSNLQDHVTVLLRPSTVCIDPNHVDLGGVLVTPWQYGSFPAGDTHDTFPAGQPGPSIVDPTVIENPQLTSLVNNIAFACMPPGRYGVNMVYPTGQAWTVPNEVGHCATTEGATLLGAGDAPGTCSLEARPVLTSQGTRAVVEIVADPNCGKPGYPAAVPTQCTSLPPGE